MQVKSLSPATMARLLELGAGAERLAVEADRAEAGLQEARRILSRDGLKLTGIGATDRELRDLYQKTQSGFDTTLKAATTARARATTATAVLNNAKRWLQDLPDGSVLEPAPAVALNGQALPAVRQRLQAIENEIARLRAAPVASDAARERIRAEVRQLARAATPDINAAGQVVWSPAVRGFETGAVSMASYLYEEQLTNKLLEQYERMCSEPPVAQRGARIAELERERVELWRIEATLIEDDPEAIRDLRPPWVVLGVEIPDTTVQHHGRALASVGAD